MAGAAGLVAAAIRQAKGLCMMLLTPGILSRHGIDPDGSIRSGLDPPQPHRA